jgi:hypothetical protein
VALFLNPRAVARAGEHLREAASLGRNRLPRLASLVLLLNACYAAATSTGEVLVSQAYLASRCGDVCVRSIRRWEDELVRAGLLERRESSGRRRVLCLADPASAGSPQVIHNQQLPSGREVSFRTRGTSIGDPRALYSSPLLHRARVSQGLVQGSEGAGTPSPTALFEQSARRFARSVGADAERSAALARAASDLAREVGTSKAASALDELRTWVRGQARRDPASLALEALRARARNARGRLEVQGNLFA